MYMCIGGLDWGVGVQIDLFRTKTKHISFHQKFSMFIEYIYYY